MENKKSFNTKTAFCTVLSDEFVLGFVVLIHSLKRIYPDFNYTFFVLHNPEVSHLSRQSRDVLESLYDDLVFIEVDVSQYDNIWMQSVTRINTPKRLKAAFLILEAFNLKGFQKIIALDSDMVVLQDIDGLLDLKPFGLHASRAFDYIKGEFLDYYNTGVMVIGQDYLNGGFYSKLLSHKLSESFHNSKGKADQAIINDLLGTDEVVELSLDYNITKRKYPDEFTSNINDLLSDGVRILHFVGEKPWQLHDSSREANYTVLEVFWRDQLAECMDGRSMLNYVLLMNYKLSVLRSSSVSDDSVMLIRENRIQDIKTLRREVLSRFDQLHDNVAARLKSRASKQSSLASKFVSIFGFKCIGEDFSGDAMLNDVESSRLDFIKESKRIEKSLRG